MRHAIDVRSMPFADAEQDQYSLLKIIGLWALVAVPMFLLAWVVAPALIPISPFHPGITFWLLIITGMIWQFVVSSVILYREVGTFSWQQIRKRLWLQAPQDPRSGQPRWSLLWWVLLALGINFLLNMFGDVIDVPWMNLLPFLEPQSHMNISELATPEFQGAWWLMGIVLVSSLFNYILGEELFFHGVLLPKMRGVFGSWDWVANGVLFGLYHLHKPWMIPSIILSCMTYALPARVFKSNWFPLIVHGFEGIILVVMVLAVIMGMA